MSPGFNQLHRRIVPVRKGSVTRCIGLWMGVVQAMRVAKQHQQGNYSLPEHEHERDTVLHDGHVYVVLDVSEDREW